MSVYLYGFVRTGMAGAAAEAVADVKGSRDLDTPRPLVAGSVTLLLSDVLAPEIKPNRRNLLAHMRALEAMQVLGDVLPVRFGQVFDDDAALLDCITPRIEAIESELGRLSGMTEVAVRVSTDREVAIAALTLGRPELKERYREISAKGPAGHFDLIELGREAGANLEAWRTAGEALLIDALRAISVDHRIGMRSDDTELLRADFLVSRTQLSALEEILADAISRLPLLGPEDVKARLVGPAPPASFVRLDFSDAGGRALGSAA